MSYTRSLCSSLVLVLAVGLVAACGHGGADQEATATPEPIPTTALALADIPGATSQTAYPGMRVEVICKRIENSIYKLVLLSEPDHAVTVEYEVGDATVYETLTLALTTIRPNGSFASIAEDVAVCDGTDRTTQFWSNGAPDPEHGVLHATAGLPDTLAGFTITTTGEDGAQHHIERIYAAVTTNNGEYPGIIVLTTVSNTDQPATPAPLDLLDAALQRADATLDPTAITTDLGPHTTPQPTNTP
ncbi:hypothetical protein [Actinomyces glycerinitolerans]|uniref:Prokaryotic membrane lipoprotein lipid attachment site profile n=1 Tax=Actinomyces glycerinitolerans TaxID=1892869 RepID=A0A1M4S2E2_9ACTO|nr:hypothetical protein [Actinomyces glycerinitolerans]SHE26310.1 Hypothetical protein ACGLYG10_2560 [Actinomyces glycerinitolerans]